MGESTVILVIFSQEMWISQVNWRNKDSYKKKKKKKKKSEK